MICIGFLILLLPNSQLFRMLQTHQNMIARLFSIGGILLWLMDLHTSMSHTVLDGAMERLGHIIDILFYNYEVF